MAAFTVKMADIILDIQASDDMEQLCSDYTVVNTAAEHGIIIDALAMEQERQRLRMKNDPGAESADGIIEGLSLCRAISEYLPTRDRVLFHGSSLAMDGNGVLFTAKSGTGKSTHTRLWRQVFGGRVVMVNDDKPFLHITPEGTTVYGTPWRGKHRLGSNLSAPLRAICIVCRGKDNRIERVTPREALPTLLQQTYTPVDPEKLRKTLALVERLSRTVPVYRLYCNMDPQAAEVACAGLGLNEKKAGAV